MFIFLPHQISPGLRPASRLLAEQPLRARIASVSQPLQGRPLVTLNASPSITMSMVSRLAEIVQAGFKARLRDLRVPVPDAKEMSPSNHRAPTPAA